MKTINLLLALIALKAAIYLNLPMVVWKIRSQIEEVIQSKVFYKLKGILKKNTCILIAYRLKKNPQLSLKNSKYS